MKKYSFILFAAFAGFISCSKETDTKVDNAVSEQTVKETITFSAGIDFETKATLSDHNINWSSGEYIYVANDQNDEIESCSITPDGEDATKCTFTATAVAGASTYYMLYYKGASSSSGITFDHTSGTFSGLNCENERYGAGASSSHADLVMAGKTADKTSVTMKPCLALVKFRAHANSVASKYSGGYSGIRGLDVYMSNGGSNLILSGDYTVNLSGSDVSVAYVDNASKKTNKRLSLSGLMASGTDYYLSIIPCGDIDKINLQFLGFNSDESVNWGHLYYMNLSQDLSVDPGDFFNFGTLNPVDLQKAYDSFTPAININGDMSDWTSIGEFEGDGSRTIKWKATSDSRNLYIYYKIAYSFAYEKGKDGYIVACIDTDNNSSTGAAGSYGHSEGFEARAISYPFTNTANTAPTFAAPASPNGNNEIKCPISGASVGQATTGGCADASYAYVEICIPRNKIGNPASGQTIRIGVSANYTASATQTIELE